MCIAIPSKIVNIDEQSVATVDVNGATKRISLQLLDNAAIGDYVIVHAGFAINKINETEALETLKTLREAVSLMQTTPDN